MYMTLKNLNRNSLNTLISNVPIKIDNRILKVEDISNETLLELFSNDEFEICRHFEKLNVSNFKLKKVSIYHCRLCYYLLEILANTKKLLL